MMAAILFTSNIYQNLNEATFKMAAKNESVLNDRIKQLCCITNCGEDEAKALLVANNFILQDSINDFYDKGGPTKKIRMEENCAETEAKSTSPCSSTFKLITWNIDGLDLKEIEARTLAVAQQINSFSPHVVYLQEVIDFSLEIITERCKGYTIHHHKEASYFCAIMMKKTSSLKFVSKDVENFPGSKMGRFLLTIHASYDGKPVSLLTTHLESCQPSTQERKNQLTRCLKKMTMIDDGTIVFFAGDLNLRDKELKEIGGLMDGIKDAWVEAGSDKSKEFSWDMELNDNLTLSGPRKPRCRFDRVYYRASKSEPISVKKFDFIGKERLLMADCFASDHWGLFCEFSFNV